MQKCHDGFIFSYFVVGVERTRTRGGGGGGGGGVVRVRVRESVRECACMWACCARGRGGGGVGTPPSGSPHLASSHAASACAPCIAQSPQVRASAPAPRSPREVSWSDCTGRPQAKVAHAGRGTGRGGGRPNGRWVFAVWGGVAVVVGWRVGDGRRSHAAHASPTLNRSSLGKERTAYWLTNETKAAPSP